jgi:hypothetical protein
MFKTDRGPKRTSVERDRVASVAAIKLELEPRYLRVSQASYCYGISRTRLFALIAEGKVKSRYLVQPGNSRGIRLIEEKSLREYVESFDSEGRRIRKEVEA